MLERLKLEQIVILNTSSLASCFLSQRYGLVNEHDSLLDFRYLSVEVEGDFKAERVGTIWLVE